MQVYIDNKKFKLKKSNYESFGVAINEIIKDLKSDNKIIQEVFVDGEKIKDYDIVNIKNLNSIEIITKSQFDILIESLEKAKIEIQELIKAFAFDKNDKSKETVFITLDDFELFEKIMFCHWFNNLLGLVEATGYFDTEYLMFKEYIKEFEREANELEKVAQEGNFQDLLMIMTSSIIPLFDFFLLNYDTLLKHIISSENSKILPN